MKIARDTSYFHTQLQSWSDQIMRFELQSEQTLELDQKMMFEDMVVRLKAKIAQLEEDLAG